MSDDEDAGQQPEKTEDAKHIPHRAKMGVPPDSPPGLELDDKGNQIPFEQRTEEDQEKARKNRPA